MPEVVDNNKVGELIKRLLKERDMSQEDLAKELSITKSAVSQNLNGKSSFDIQNLIAISKLFDISMEDLLVQESSSDGKTMISEYEKLVKKGAKAFATLDVKNMNINTPDIYGNALIEYVIENDDIDIFNLLHLSNVKLVEDTHHKARIVYTKIICFALKHEVDDVKRYIDTYVSLYASLVFPDEEYSAKIWELLNTLKYQGLVLMLFDSKLEKRMNVIFNIPIKKKIAYLTRTEWLEHIGKYKLDMVLKAINFKLSFINDYETMTKIFLSHKFFDGIIWYMNKIDYVINSLELRIASSQDVIFEIAEAGELSVFSKALEKGLYVNLDKLVSRLILAQNKASYDYCIDNYKEKLDFQQVAYSAAIASNLELLIKIINNLNQNDLDYILSITDIKDLEILEYLVSKGAKFETEYFNSNTMAKANKVVNSFMERGKK